MQQQSLNLGDLFCSNDWIVLADFGLGQLAVVERTFVHIRVAVHTAELTATATVKTYSTQSSDMTCIAKIKFKLLNFILKI